MEKPKLYKIEWKTTSMFPINGSKVLIQTYDDEYYIDHIDGNFEGWSDMIMRWAYIKAEKTGKWIEERTYLECPNCHDIWHYEENQTERFKFCPTCGEMIK